LGQAFGSFFIVPHRCGGTLVLWGSKAAFTVAKKEAEVAGGK